MAGPKFKSRLRNVCLQSECAFYFSTLTVCMKEIYFSYYMGFSPMPHFPTIIHYFPPSCYTPLVLKTEVMSL